MLHILDSSLDADAIRSLMAKMSKSFTMVRICLTKRIFKLHMNKRQNLNMMLKRLLKMKNLSRIIFNTEPPTLVLL